MEKKKKKKNTCKYLAYPLYRSMTEVSSLGKGRTSAIWKEKKKEVIAEYEVLAQRIDN